jgi:hypothetical protein
MVIIIKAKKWFDKINGNTYHSVIVYKNGKEVGRSPMTYGYGDAFMQTAFEIMQKKGLYKKTGKRLASGMDADYYNFMMDAREKKHKNQMLVFEDEVARQKDLDKVV